jgi:starch phosphorylase
LFGLNADEVSQTKAEGYNSKYYYESNPILKEAIDQINSGYFSHLDVNTFRELTDSLMYDDQYLVFADFQSYLEAQDKVSEAFKHKEMWAKMSILNTARMGKFSSDRSIREYCDEIWKVKSVPVEIDSIKIVEK